MLVDGLIIVAAGALHGQENLDPLMGQRPQGLVMFVPGGSLLVIESLRPRAGAARGICEQMQRSSSKLPAAAAEVDLPAVPAGLRDRSGTREGPGLARRRPSGLDRAPSLPARPEPVVEALEIQGQNATVNPVALVPIGCEGLAEPLHGLGID